MRKKLLTLGLAFLLMHAGSAGAAFAKSNGEKEARAAARVHTALLKLGTGESARVEVKLRNKTKLVGYVAEIGPDSFVVKDFETGTATAVPYPQVKQVKGNNLSTGAKIAIGVGIAVVVLLLIYRAKCDAYCF